MKINSYRYLRANYPNTFILILEGCFYCARENDAYILNEYLGYQLFDETYSFFSRKKAGFPDCGLDKVLNTLGSHRINYIVVENYEIVEEQSFQNNAYRYYPPKARERKFDLEVSQRPICLEPDTEADIVRKNSAVTIEYVISKELYSFILAPVHRTEKYTGMGGSYYGSFSYHSVDYVDSDTDDSVTEDSPLGQAIMGKRVGDVISFTQPKPNMFRQTVKIISVKQGP